MKIQTTKTALPPEWAPQSAVMLTWPHQDTIWADTLDAIDKVFVHVATEVAQREKVIISCFDEKHREHILKLLHAANVDLTQVHTYLAPSDDIWVRDHGPITVIDEQQRLRLYNFTFNGWGNKYPAERDNQITQKLYQQGAFDKAPLKTIARVIEGGALEVDGHGTLLTTRSCLLSATRNPDLTTSEIEQELKQLLGLKRVLWLDHGYLAGDDTDGHIDTLVRFADPHTLCYVSCDVKTDEHYTELKAMESELRALNDYQGNPYRLVPLPWPRARFADYDGRRLPVTYANFLIINGAVLVPTYDDPADENAVAILSQCFPDRKIIAIPSLAAVQWYGSLHCMTMQIPEEPPSP